ncbi:MAG: ABC transporter ATP-binding protein [Eubacterium sp.]|nr:ABC transporter ATP-binding protein [Eubacterium sp.]
MIEVKNLVKQYGDHRAVDDLSFHVDQGQIVGFLGPNGAGKSTTMNVITGYIAASQGQVLIDGHDVMEEPEEAKKCIGYLPEIPPLYPDMRVWEYLEFVYELKKCKREDKEEVLEEIMERTQILDVEMRLIKNLSKGYKQRVGLAAAMIGNPKILILDEPTVGLDPKQILEIRDLIRELSKDHTILLSSHIMQEVSAVCNYILIINEGKLVAQGSPDQIAGSVEQYNQIDFTVRAGEAEVKEALEGMEGIRSLEISQEETECQVQVKTDVETDLREEIFFALAEAKKPIVAMNMYQPSLEEAFIALTGQGSDQGASRKNKKEEAKDKC